MALLKVFQMYEPANWARIRADKLQTHFLYLMTPDKVGNFHLADVLYGPRSLPQQVEAFERALIADALRRHGGSLARTAEALGSPKTTLHDKIRKYGLDG